MAAMHAHLQKMHTCSYELSEAGESHAYASVAITNAHSRLVHIFFIAYSQLFNESMAQCGKSMMETEANTSEH